MAAKAVPPLPAGRFTGVTVTTCGGGGARGRSERGAGVGVGGARGRSERGSGAERAGVCHEAFVRVCL
jgi:hypothetical protein